MVLEDDKFDQMLALLRLRLKDFEPANEKTPDLIWKPSHKFTVKKEDAPIPGLLYFVFALLKFPRGGREEKIHWIVPFRFKSINCAVALEKMGLRLYVESRGEEPEPSINPQEIIDKLHKSIMYLEKAILTPLATEQIKSGNITIANHYCRLDNMYHYFRGQAKSAFLPKKVIDSDDISKHLSSLLNSHFTAAKEGAYNSLAMIDAFFSKLEHTLVLLLPFSNYSRVDDNLAAFIGSNWSEKYKRIFRLESVAKAKNFYDRLDKVKETYRNTFAHGGFDKNGSSIYFHIPGIGAVPASLTDYKNSPHFNFMPVDELNHDEICLMFDGFEEWLEQESAVTGMIYVKSGLDIPLDEEHLAEVHQHCGSIEDFEEWVRAESLYRDMIENADY